MENQLGNPFSEQKQRKPGVAPLVGEVFGKGAEQALKKVIREKKKEPESQENWEGDITMTGTEREKMQIEKDHVRLHDVPTFARLPAANVMNTLFKFDLIWVTEYRSGRPIVDFSLTEEDLADLRLDERARASIMEAMNTRKESLPLAKIFDIGEIIRQKQEADPDHPDYLSTREVFEAMDVAGYRPATLRELLAYSRDYWKPNVDGDALTDEEEKRLQFANVPNVYALGSPFLNDRRNRSVPCIRWANAQRHLGALNFDSTWLSNRRFLAIRK